MLVETGPYAELRVRSPGGPLLVDPWRRPPPGRPVLLTWTEPERTRGVRLALEDGRRPPLFALPALRSWLGCPAAPPGGLRVELVEYRPIPYATPVEALRKARAAIVRPAWGLRRIAGRLRLPRVAPVVAAIDLPGGRRVVHLNGSLHRWTPPGWLRERQEAWRGADLLVVGADWGEGGTVVREVPGFAPARVLVADLLGPTRRAMGMPAEPLGPMAEGLRRAGLQVDVAVSRP